jgi:hypothetical protein
MRVNAQEAVFNNSGTWIATPFLKIHPQVPSTFNDAAALKLGFNYSSFAHRVMIYGGGYRNSWQADISGQPWSAWQEQMKFSLYRPTVGPPFLFSPGTRYLANRHNWSGYQAIFGLRERVSMLNTLNIETGMYEYTENDEPKDAIISFSYPTNTSEANKSRLIFEAIALDTIQNTAGIGDLQTELATLTHRGNFGFRSTNPQARIEILGQAGLEQNINNQARAFSVLGDNSDPLFLVTTSSDGSLMGFGTDVPNAKIAVHGNGGLTKSANIRPRVLSVVDDENIEKIAMNNGYSYTNSQNNIAYRPASLWLNQPTGSTLDVELYAGGATWLQAPNTRNSNNQITGGCEFILEGSGIYSNTEYDNKMSTELLGNSYKISDNTHQYLNMTNGEVYMNVLKTASGLSYITVNSSGQLQRSNSFPDPNTVWSFDGNYFPSGSSIKKFGSTSGSQDIEIRYVFNDKIVGFLTPTTVNGNTAATFTLKNAIALGCLNDGVTQPTVLGRTALTVYGNDIFTNRNGAMNNVSWLIQGKTYDGGVRSFGVQQNGIIEQGYLPWSFSFSNTTLRFNSMISIGDIVGSLAPDYAIARWKISSGGTSMEPMFAVRYAEPTIILGKSEIRDISGTSGTNPEKLEVKGALIPSIWNGYSLGSSTKVWTDIYAFSGSVNSSDLRLKKDITPIAYGLEYVLKLNPVSYKFKDYTVNDNIRFGFIAQELDKVLPNSVVVGKETDSTYLGVRYDEIIPVLTKAIQEQHAIIENQEREIEIIKAKVLGNGSLGSSSSNGNMNKEPVLFQNAPNPFSEFTNIDYFIPENTTQASITVTDPAGKLVYSYTINSTGMGRVILKDESIAQGNYYYSLYANGRLIDTKQLSVVKN